MASERRGARATACPARTKTRLDDDRLAVIGSLGDDDMVVVSGVNHAATGVATYSSFAVDGDRRCSALPDGRCIEGRSTIPGAAGGGYD
ncbi:hypothetical protein [Anaeromyxobacter terrae]|uniref:hypothetical protein n=1 Tax=Anaeromyxobacter terrae TaxID=2925406 RepID=UPI001F567102|nr:hypothetical protein [Anaeromyxobacter sp. SG22]